MDEGLKKFLFKKDIPSMNSTKFQYENHGKNNMVLFYFKELINGTSCKYASKVLGYTEHPVYKEEDGYGFMFETNTGEEFWCHIYPDSLLNLLEK